MLMNSISAKLFLALVGLTTLVLGATLVPTHWSFNQGFSEYIRDKEELRLQVMATELAKYFMENDGQWDEGTVKVYESVYLRSHPEARKLSSSLLVKPSNEPQTTGFLFPPQGLPTRFPAQRAPNNNGDFGINSQSLRIPQSGPTGEGSPPRLGPPPRAGSPPRAGPPPRVGRPPRMRPPRVWPPRVRPGILGPPTRVHPTAMFDSAGKYVAGVRSFPKNLPVIEVEVMANDLAVAYLRTVVENLNEQSLEVQFSQRQMKTSIVVALMSLLISLLASWWLVRTLVAPLLVVKGGVKALAQGDFSNRLAVNRQDEIGGLMIDINRLSEVLGENREVRKRWLADISHELRTPVSILAGEIEAIQDGIRNFDDEQLDSLSHEVTRLRQLINDLYELSLSDIGGLRYRFQAIDLNEVLNSVIGSYTKRFLKQDIAIKSDIAAQLVINADPNRFEQLLINLLNNSLAYTDKPGGLTIIAAARDGRVRIVFEDSAPTVPEDMIEKIFEPLFRQDSSRSRRVAGAGLGLTICRNIVQAHNGSIYAQQSVQGGLKITLEFEQLES
jgi:two-component system sensor histidine kinase BaeS